MIGNRGCILALTLHALFPLCGFTQTLWREPPPATVSDFIWGPGGEQAAPRPPFRFLKEKLSGTNPKVDVLDATGRHWIVKFGSEVHADTFAPRLLNALGYAAAPTYYVADGSMQSVHDLKRAKHFISKDGSFRTARFKLHCSGAESDVENVAWSWVSNPFMGSRELGGLKIMMMLTSNWDAKDSRDGPGESNTGTIRSAAGPTSGVWYAVTDWGASFGRSGGYLRRDRWDWGAYRSQTPDFVRLAPDGHLIWGFKGKHVQDITEGVGLDDVRWLLPYLSRITDQDLEAGLEASGASPAVARDFTRSIRQRIEQLQGIAQSSTIRQAAK